jgi:hypothetical protein
MDTKATRRGVDASIQVLLLPYPILGLSPSGPYMALAESLTEIGINVIYQPLSFLNLPHLLEILNPSGYLDDTDAEPLVRALVIVLSKTNRDENRILIMLLIKTVANWWRSKETIWKKLCEIVDPLAKDDDEAVRMLSIPMTVAPLPVLGEK